MKYIIFFLIFSPLLVSGQGGFAFGVKGGLTATNQKWTNYERSPLLKYHGAAYIEGLGETSAFYAQLGYHLKGSQVKTYGFNQNNSFRTKYIFKNIGIQIGAKKKIDFNNNKLYYGLGLRGEYTVGTNFEDIVRTFAVFPPAPSDPYVEKFNYGISLVGGIEVPFADLVGILIELSIHPDMSKQYRQPPFENVTDYSRPTPRQVSLREVEIINVALELSVGFRFLRKIEYID